MPRAARLLLPPRADRLPLARPAAADICRRHALLHVHRRVLLGVLAKTRRQATIHTWQDLIKRFPATVELFNVKLIGADKKVVANSYASDAASENRRMKGDGVSSCASSRSNGAPSRPTRSTVRRSRTRGRRSTGSVFGRAWTAIVDSRRSRDLLSSREAGLRFGAVRAARRRALLLRSARVHADAAPSSPRRSLALSLWRTPLRDARYKLLAPGLVQCRDVAVLLLVQIGVVEQPEAREPHLVPRASPRSRASSRTAAASATRRRSRCSAARWSRRSIPSPPRAAALNRDGNEILKGTTQLAEKLEEILSALASLFGLTWSPKDTSAISGGRRSAPSR